MQYRLQTLFLPLFLLLLTYQPKLFAQCNNNIALGQPVTVSSIENNDNALYDPAHVVDGNQGTRWSSNYTDSEWMYVDLGSDKQVCQVVIKWEDAYGKDFDLIYWDGSTWQVIQSVTNNSSTTNTFNINMTVQYIGFQGQMRATEFGYSIWEFEVYEEGGGKPDYVPSNMTGPSTAAPGQNVVVDLNIANNSAVAGNGGNGKDRYYFGENPGLWGTYTEIKNFDTGDLGPWASFNVNSGDLTIPGGTSPGTYYIIFYMDADDYVDESNENNNIAYHQITIQAKPDYVPSNMTGPSTAYPGQNVVVDLNIANNSATAGNGGNGKDRYYFGENPGLWGTYTEIKNFDTGDLGPWASFNVNSGDLTIPNGTSSGTYYIIFFMDADDYVDESDENNNIAYHQITIQGKPDYTVQTMSTPTNPIIPGTGFTMMTTLANQGTVNYSGNASQTRYYLSTDANLDGGDVTLTPTFTTPSLNAGQSQSFNFNNLVVPSGTSSGNYYIIIHVDYNDQIDETNENNNTYALAVTVGNAPKPDYTVTSMSTATNPIIQGVGFTVSATLANQGNANYSGNASQTRYYLSTDANLDGGDVTLTPTFTTPSLNAGQSQSFNFNNLVVPVSVSNGNYYIIIHVDYNDQIDETNENNNTYAQAVTVGNLPEPDLNPQSPSLTVTSVIPGNTTQASCTVYNIGTSTAAASKLGYYLSTNTTYEATDIYLDVDDVILLNAGGSYFVSKTLSIPAGTPQGNYYILFFADYLNVVAESDENNNVAYFAITVLPSVSPPDANFTASSTSICQGEIVNFFDTSTNSPTSWSWSFSPGSVSYVNGTNATSKNPQVQFNAPGPYTVSLTATNAGGSDIETKTNYIAVALTQVPQVSITPSSVAVCEGQGITFAATPVNGGSGPFYQWKLDGINVGLNSPSYTLTNPTNGATVSVIMTSSLSCVNPQIASSNTVQVTVYPKPSVSLASFPSLLTTDPPYTLVEGSPAGGVYSGTGVSGGLFDPSIGAGNYTIAYTYTDANGCVGTSSGIITVSEPSLSPFTWSPTNLSGFFNGQAHVEGVPASGADWIAAFDQDNNCAGAAQIIISGGNAFINLPIYGDDPTTGGVDEGINAGESFRLVLYDASEDEYLDYPYQSNITQFTQWSNTNGTPIPAYNNPNIIYNFLRITTITDVVALDAGWNLISIDVIPSDSSVGSVFAGLSPGNLEFVTGFDGGSIFYDPNGLPFLNTLTHIEKGYGYWVKVAAQDVLTVTGTPIDPAYKKPLEAGWNLSAYIPQSSSTPGVYFNSLILANQLIYATGFDGGSTFYDPNGLPFLNTLTSLQNGKGYWVRVTTDVSSYRQSSVNMPTPTYMFLNGHSNLQTVGETIEVLDSQGEFITKMMVMEDGYLMTAPIYGDDPSTDRIEGISEGEELQFAYQGQIIKPGIRFESDQTYKQVELKFSPQAYLHAFPNPFTGYTQILYELPSSAEVSISVWDVFGRHVTDLAQGEKRSGQHVVGWQATNQSEGVYIVKLMIDNKLVGHRRLLLQK